MANKKEVNSIIRINKKNVPSIQSKGLFYYVDANRNEEGDITNVIYGLVDNRKGKKVVKEFDSIKELEESIK
jgi:hypothetical protein